MSFQSWKMKLSASVDREPEKPDQRKVSRNQESVDPCDDAKVVRQERQLKLQQYQNRNPNKRDPDHDAEKPSVKAISLFGRPGKQLDDQERIQPRAQEIPIIFCSNVLHEDPVVGRDSPGKRDKIEKKIKVKQKKEERRNCEEGDQGQLCRKDR